MPDVRYQNFDLTIQKEGKGYRIKVDSPAGEASGRFRVPFSDLELENFYLTTTPGKRSVRRIDSPEVAVAKKYGERLFKAVFADEVLGRLQSALNEADRSEDRLRIRLRLTGVPELTDLPWDYLYNPALNRFLALGNDTALVRYLELPERVRPVTVQLPLKMLVVISSPNDFSRLDVDQEWANLNEVLGELAREGLVSLDLLEDATMPELRRRLAKEQYNIFHFIGHGAFDRQTEEGVLVLKDENGRGRLVSGQQLGVLTHNHKSLALAVLNACEGAKGDRTDVFAGTAQSLVQQGIPAVVAMQREITDDAAKVFAHAFYSAVAAGQPVEAAMTETRIALYAEELGLEWATPVLYMRAQDGRVFDLQAPVAKPVQPPVAPSAPVATTPPVTRGADVVPVVESLTTVVEPPKKEEVVAPLPVVEEAALVVKQDVSVVPETGNETAKKRTASTDEMLRSFAGDMAQKSDTIAADHVALALEKAKRDTEKESKKNNPRMNNMVLVALGLIGVVAAIVLVIWLVSGNGGGASNDNNGGTDAEATATPSLPFGVLELLSTRTADAELAAVESPTPGTFEKLEEKAFVTPLPAGSEADSIVFSEDEAFLAVWFYVGNTSEGFNIGKIVVWSLDSDEPIAEFDVKGYDRTQAQMAFFPSEGDSTANRRFSYIEANKDIRVRHLTDPQYNNDLYIEDAISLAVSFDGANLAVGLRSGDAVVWDMATLEKRFSVSGHSNGVQHVAFAPYNYVLATTDWRNTRVWESGADANLYDVSHDLGNNDLPILSVISHDGINFGVCSAYGNCEFWLFENGDSIGTPDLDSLDTSKLGRLLAAGMTRDDTIFVTGWANGTVGYFNDGGLVHSYETVVDGADTRVMALSSSMHRMALVTPDNHVQVWSLP